MQEVKKLTDSLVKDSKKYEKEQVGLAEKKKHLTTKQKKFKKSLTEVSRLITRHRCQFAADRQDGHARSEAKSSIENYSGELEVNRKKVADLEKKLETEEAELEEIRDSLKGMTHLQYRVHANKSRQNRRVHNADRGQAARARAMDD